MAIMIYQETATGRKQWAESTSVSTLRKLAAAEWVLFDASPADPPPAPDGLDAAVALLTRTPGSLTSTEQRAASGSVAATVTVAGALVVQKHNPVDATAGPLTMTLPTGAPEGSQLSVEKADSSTNLVTVTGSIRGSAGSIALTYQRETLQFRADASGSWFPVAGHRTKASLDVASIAAVGAVVIVHGSAASTARPNTPGPVVWFGSVSPTNADATLDIWQRVA